MSSTSQGGEAPYTCVSIEIPTEHAPTVQMMLRGVRRHRHLQSSAVPLIEDSDLPPLFTMMENEKERLVPAVQRPHIRAFAQHTGDQQSGLGERFISAVWGMPVRYPHLDEDLKAVMNWGLLERLVLTDSVGRVQAIQARKMPEMHSLLATGQADLFEFGSKTLGFVERLTSAVHQSLFAFDSRDN